MFRINNFHDLTINIGIFFLHIKWTSRKGNLPLKIGDFYKHTYTQHHFLYINFFKSGTISFIFFMIFLELWMMSGEGGDRGWDGWMAYWLNGHESEQTLGDSEGQRSLACCSPWGCKESDTTERLNWIDVKYPELRWTYYIDYFVCFLLILLSHDY